MNSTEYKEIIDVLKIAFKDSIANGGVSQYTLNSGQGQTMVKQSSTQEIETMLFKYEKLYSEAVGIETGSNIGTIRGW